MFQQLPPSTPPAGDPVAGGGANDYPAVGLCPTAHRVLKPRMAILLTLIGLILANVYVARAQSSPTPTPVPITVKSAKTYTKVDGQAGMGDWIAIEVDKLSEAVEKDRMNPREFVLYLDGRALKGVNALPVEDRTSNKLAFQLRRTDDSREAWGTLLGRPSLGNNLREVRASVGFADKQAIPFFDPENPTKIYLRVYHPGWLVAALILLVLAAIGFVWLAITTDVIRDANPPKPEGGKRKPYSLALAQAAWWFFLVMGSFLFIYLITGDHNTITDQALILMGIGTGTALGAAMINATKRDTANNDLSALNPEKARLDAEIDELTNKVVELETKVTAAGTAATDADKQALSTTRADLQEKRAKLAETVKKINDAESGLTKPASEDFVRDLLTDVGGVNLHRFQMVVWTIVLSVLFCAGVYKELAMPAFSGTLLALMGISSGTYLGFKIPEKQN